MAGPFPEHDRTMHGEYKVPRGKLVVVDLDVAGGRLRDVHLTGDFFLYPEDALVPMTAALEGAPAGLGAHEYCLRIAEATPPATEMLGFSPCAIAIAVVRAQESQPDDQ
jgi:lipoate-protein ligase A